jgi:hypothetical protein
MSGDLFEESKNNKKCYGPCYKSNNVFIHPIIFGRVINRTDKYNVCPTERYVENDITKIYDYCEKADNLEKIDINLLRATRFSTASKIDKKVFLKNYYGITSFEDACDALGPNQSFGYYTKKRIIENSFKVYGYNIDILNDNLINFFIDSVKKEYIYKIYIAISKYLYYNKNSIIIKKDKSNKVDIKADLKQNYILDKIITKQMMYKVLNKYITDNKSNWKDIVVHNDQIQIAIQKYIINKIKNTI